MQHQQQQHQKNVRLFVRPSVPPSVCSFIRSLTREKAEGTVEYWYSKIYLTCLCTHVSAKRFRVSTNESRSCHLLLKYEIDLVKIHCKLIFFACSQCAHFYLYTYVLEAIHLKCMVHVFSIQNILWNVSAFLVSVFHESRYETISVLYIRALIGKYQHGSEKNIMKKNRFLNKKYKIRCGWCFLNQISIGTAYWILYLYRVFYTQKGPIKYVSKPSTCD